jgi:hypothetical protein
VFDRDGRLLGIADLLDLEAGLVGEFDGADHRSAGRHSRDVRREDGLRRVGLEVFRVTGPDLLDRALVVERMLAARRRARWEPGVARDWTVTPPPAWERSLTLDEELDHRDLLRSWHEAV